MIGDRYEPIEQIGTGGMATVWRARDTLLGRLVAIKRLLPHLATDPVAAARFNREAQAAARLNHPGIVTVFDTGEDEEGPFIVLELVEGITLADRLAEGGALSPATAVGIVSQIASALDHAHAQGVVHRDIKPANIILDRDGRAQLADFGIARTVEDPTTITASGELIGTIAYLAPEILAGRPATPASDIYSLGAVSYELLAGTPPYRAASPAALLEAVRTAPPPSLRGIAPDQMAAAVSAAMTKDPGVRPRTASELASAMLGSATLVIGADRPVTRPSSSPTASEQPTVVTAVPVSDQPVSTGRARWAALPALIGVIALAAAAMTADRDPASSDGTGDPLAASPTTTMTTNPTSTTIPPTTTTIIATTTTTVAITTTLPSRTPEAVAAEIEDILDGLEPSDFGPREVRQVDDRLERVMNEWSKDNREKLIEELERAFEEVDDLGETLERDEVRSRFIELAELMGFEVQQGDGDDDRDDD